MTNDTTISNNEIRLIIDQLYDTVGVRPEYVIRDIPFTITKDKFALVASSLLEHMGLPITLVPDYTSAYESTGLTRAGSQQGVAAQVIIPGDLPLISSSRMRGFPITVRLRLGNDSAFTLLTMLTHELSHVLLHSWAIPLKESEHATDLCALMMGFGRIWDAGRKRTTSEQIGDRVLRTTTTHGYLSDNNYEFARSYIAELLHHFEECRVHARITIGDVQDLCDDCAKQAERLIDAVSYHRKRGCRVRKSDADTFSSICRPHFSDDVRDAITKAKSDTNALVRALNARRPVWGKAYLAELQNICAELDGIYNRLYAQSDALEAQYEIVERNLSLWAKILRFFQPSHKLSL